MSEWMERESARFHRYISISIGINFQEYAAKCDDSSEDILCKEWAYMNPLPNTPTSGLSQMPYSRDQTLGSISRARYVKDGSGRIVVRSLSRIVNSESK